MDVAKDVQEKGGVVDDLHENVLELAEVVLVDDGVDAFLEGLHGLQGFVVIADEDDGGVTAQV